MTKIAPRPRARRGLWAVVCLSCALAVTPGAAYGRNPPPCESAVLTVTEAADLLRVDVDEVERLAEQKEIPARRIGSSWRFNCAAMMAWVNGDWELITSAVAPPTADLSSVVVPDAPPPEYRGSLTTRDMAEVTATGTVIAQGGTTRSASAQPPADGQEPIGEAPEERNAEDVFLRGQRVLLGRGEVVVDFGQFYARSDSQPLVSVGAGVGLGTLEQETFVTLLVGRIGILDETELFASTTFLNQDGGVLGSTTFASSGLTEFGNIGVGVRHTFLREGVDRPDIIGSLDVRIPTGDTAYAVGGGLVFVKSVDPVVLFTSVNYLHTLSRDFSNVARVAPDDRFDVSVGYGLALNDTLAISMAVSGLFTGTTTFDDVPLRRPNAFSGRFGLTTWLAGGLYIEPSVSFSLSGPGSSVAFGVTMPYAF